MQHVADASLDGGVLALRRQERGSACSPSLRRPDAAPRRPRRRPPSRRRSRWRPSPRRCEKPNIVVVLLDDFSIDLVQTLRSAQRMRRRGALLARLRHRLAVLRLAHQHLHRPVPPPDGRPHQHLHRERTPLGGWEAFAGYGNPERSFNVALQQSGYTTGFVGKYLNEYEWVPGRTLPPARPAGRTSTSSSAPPTTAGTSPTTSVIGGRAACASTTRRRSAPAERRTGLCGQRDRRLRDELHQEAPGRGVRRTSSRSRPTRRTTAPSRSPTTPATRSSRRCSATAHDGSPATAAGWPAPS